MPISHLLVVLLVVAIWGCNFIFVKLSLDEISPLLLCAVRFLLASVPAVFFIKPPAAPIKLIVLYGLLMFGLQFSLLFMGMYAGMSPGLASILGQVQVFFSIIFAAIFLAEIPSAWQIVGALISFAGIALVGLHIDQNTTLSGFILIIAASAAWGLGNLVTKKMGRVNTIALVVWGSLVACLPLFILSLIFEGKDSIMYSFHHVSGLGITSVLYIVYVSTWIGYGGWNWLISRHSVATVVPFSLLVPIVAMLSSAIFLNESFEPWKIAAALLVLTGLCINFLAPRFLTKKAFRTGTPS